MHQRSQTPNPAIDIPSSAPLHRELPRLDFGNDVAFSKISAAKGVVGNRQAAFSRKQCNRFLGLRMTFRAGRPDLDGVDPVAAQKKYKHAWSNVDRPITRRKPEFQRTFHAL
jgi:hypothetical protein